MSEGRVVWILGLSGAGKTSVGTELRRRMRSPAFLLDGDALREAMGNDLGHSLENRRLQAWRLARLGALLSRQGISVVCPNLGLFPEVRAWNRKNLKCYFEAYLRVPLEVLKSRDPKGIYRGNLNVAGVDLPFAEPEGTDLVLDNAEPLASLAPLAERILEALP